MLLYLRIQDVPIFFSKFRIKIKGRTLLAKNIFRAPLRLLRILHRITPKTLIDYGMLVLIEQWTTYRANPYEFSRDTQIWQLGIYNCI